MNADFLVALKNTVTPSQILTDSDSCAAYDADTSSYHQMPIAVVFAHSHDEIQTIITLCNDYHVPLTVRGGGSATTGAATPVLNGIVLSLERMNKIIKIEPENRLMIVEAGVTNQAVQQEAGKYGLFWAPDPGSAAYCTVGGNIACNAGGPHTLKYGSTRENILGLKGIIGTGSTIHTGGYTTKSAVGYDLTRLLIGSEGTLAVISEATLKLIPKPEATATLQAIYSNIHDCADAIAHIMMQPVMPAALEFLDAKALQLLNQHGNFDFPKDAKALLIIEIDNLKNALPIACEKIKLAANNSGLISIKAGLEQAVIEKLWEARRALSPALKNVAPKKINEDVIVPVGNIPKFMHQLELLSQEYALQIINFGHGGNGNIHVNLMIDPKDPIQRQNADACLEKIFNLVLQLNGSLSGEHGIGLDKKRFLVNQIGNNSLHLMHQIKKIFDPENILNPGKVLPADNIN